MARELDDLIDEYYQAALRATGTRDCEPRAPVFATEVETPTDADSAASLEELHVAMMVAQQPELPRVLFMTSRPPTPVPPLVDLDDEITNVMQRFG
ncbi:MAG: hypothetical protein ABI175_05770 [Polyangiales bacterium]